MAKSRSKFGEQVARDFPDGFMATFEHESPDEDDFFLVIDTDDMPEYEGKPNMVLRTVDEDRGVVTQIIVEDYEIIDLEPTTARVKVMDRKHPMIWMDSMTDEVREETRKARMTDEEFEAADRPLSGKGSRQEEPEEPAAESTAITPEQAEENPDLRARALIGELLKEEEE